jgi:peptidoglycan/xylan/chitin deacetylase (PgdA/CDA1 family)
VARFAGRAPKRWGQTLPGIRTHVDTTERAMALTFDLCEGRGYDDALVEFLVREQIPATIFVTGKWIRRNAALFQRLSRAPGFDIENHGLWHKPASVNGQKAYGIAGTRSIAELIEEVDASAAQIEAVTGRRPRLFRSGTAFYDDVAVSVVAALGDQPVGYSILGDAGGIMTAGEVKAALLKADPGAIAILHLNHPESGTAQGVISAIPELVRSGFHFVKLSDHALR